MVELNDQPEARESQSGPGRKSETFFTHCPADPPEQESHAQSHRYHGKASGKSPTHNGIDQPPEKQSDEKKSRENCVEETTFPKGREKPAQHSHADSRCTRG